MRLIYEKHLFAGPNQDILCNEEPFEDFTRRYVFLINPTAKQFQSDQVYLEYMDKYLLMTKELVISSLRNTSRQRRGAKRFFNDLAILIQEGNFTDDILLSKNDVQPAKHTTVCLLLSINLTLVSMLRYLDQVFQLDMIKMEELQPSLMYMAYVY